MALIRNKGSQKPKVLVVDDEPSILSSISDLLEAEFDVITSTDPRRGLDDLSLEEFAVVISDQRMPDMNGDQFLRLAKERSAATRVLLTGFADIEALARVVNDGKIYAYVTKPWDPLDLRTTVRNAATEYRLLNALRYERDLLRALVNNIPDCIYVQDSEQRYTLVNEAFAELAGLSHAQEAAGTTELDCLPGEFGQTASADGRMILDTGHPIISKCDEWRGDDGVIRWYSSTRVPVRNPVDGSIKALVGISRDVTKQKQIENHLRVAKEMAEETVRAKQEFLARTSHEIRTPLNSILGMGELLSATDLSERQKQYMGIFRSNGEALMRLLSDLLDLSRSDLRELRLACADFDPLLVVRGVIGELEESAAVKGVGVGFDFGDNIPARLVGDSERLKQILANLVSNALKFTPQGGILITMKVLSREDRTALLEFSVEDTGIGIAAEKLNHIFEPFGQAEKFETSPYRGSGLGLTICRQLVQQMGGNIWVESAPGAGSTFRFTARFQIAENQRPAETQPLSSKPAEFSKASFDGLRVLLAEDNEDNVFLMQAYLGPEKIEVAANGREAVDKFVAGKFDVVLMDLQMPEMDGLEATRLIREWERLNRMAVTPILACTAHSTAEEASLEAGCTAHLNKPIARDTLLSAIADCVAVSR
jgi:PAS domain S-box-containing protein